MVSTNTIVVEAARAGPVAEHADYPFFFESIVARVCNDSGASYDDVLAYAAELTYELSDARLQSFVPLLVEKHLRDRWRRRPAAELA